MAYTNSLVSSSISSGVSRAVFPIMHIGSPTTWITAVSECSAFTSETTGPWMITYDSANTHTVTIHLDLATQKNNANIKNTENKSPLCLNMDAFASIKPASRHFHKAGTLSLPAKYISAANAIAARHTVAKPTSLSGLTAMYRVNGFNTMNRYDTRHRTNPVYLYMTIVTSPIDAARHKI